MRAMDNFKKEVTLASLLAAGAETDAKSNWLEAPNRDVKSEVKGELEATLDFIEEAVVETAGATLDLLGVEETDFIEDAKGRLKEDVIRDLHLILGELANPLMREKFVSMISDAVFSAYVLGNYSTSSWQLLSPRTHLRPARPFQAASSSLERRRSAKWGGS
jgi:hypothetical protein